MSVADSKTQHPPRVARRRAIFGVAAAVAIATAAVLVLLLWPSGGGGTGLRDRALAAVGSGRVLHVITRTPTGEQLVSLRTGRTIKPTMEAESWSDETSRRFHDIVRVGGRPINEGLSTHPASPGFDPASIWFHYRQALVSGAAKLERSGRLYGNDVYWFEFPSYQQGFPPNEVAVDRKTYRPVALRVSQSEGHIDYRVLLARTEEFSVADFRRQTAPQRRSPEVSFAMTWAAPTGRPKVSKPWLDPGSTVAGVRLSSVQRPKMTIGAHTWTGIELVYGRSASPSTAPLVVDEQEHADPSWSGIPRGFIRIDGAAAPSSPRRLIWIGQLLVHRTYVTIKSRIGRAAVLQAARSLRPV